MFLTTEPSLVGRKYQALQVVFATKRTSKGKQDAMVEDALAQIYAKATSLGADAVIGVHVSISIYYTDFAVAVMGTAIKFY